MTNKKIRPNQKQYTYNKIMKKQIIKKELTLLNNTIIQKLYKSVKKFNQNKNKKSGPDG